MSDLKHEDEERLSRRQAAERLVDIAYALTAGGPLELNAAGRRITVPVANELRLGRALRSEGDRVELELELTWAIPEASSAAKRSRGD
jgi:amphi-Trp domain-containing protein